MLKDLFGRLKRNKHSFMLYAFAKGETVELSAVEDEVFSSGILGKGIAIDPVDGRIYAPCSGVIENVFDTHHALNIVSDFGCEILIHMGIDTVTLKGKYFDLKVKEGDRVNKGDLLCIFDVDGIKSEGLKTTTPMVVCNSDDYSTIDPRPQCTINVGDGILRIIK